MNLRSRTLAPATKPTQAPATDTISLARWPRRNSIVTLLIFACLTMCFVAFEQNRTITSQQELIRSLFRDSLELNAMKMHGLRSDQQPDGTQLPVPAQQ